MAGHLYLGSITGMKKALELVRTRQGCAIMEIQPRFDILLHGKNVGQMYFNLRGYVGSLPTPEGSLLQMPESCIGSFEREVSRLNREFAALNKSAQ
jgi:hypothetical protein